MEHLSKKWAIAREKLATSIELRMNSLHEELHELEEKADKTTGPGREKMHAEMHTVAAFAVILVTPVTGALSDRLGRKSVLIFLSACSTILPLGLFYSIPVRRHLPGAVAQPYLPQERAFRPL